MLSITCDLIMARQVCPYSHSTSMNLKYFILRADLHVHVHDCRSAVYLLAAVELDPWTLTRDVGYVGTWVIYAYV